MTDRMESANQREAALRAIVRVIADSPSDYGPVLDTILEHATALTGAPLGGVLLCDGEHFRLAAERGMSEGLRERMLREPMSIKHGISGQAAREQRPVHVEDVQNHEPTRGEPHRLAGMAHENMRTQLAVPMVLGGTCLGIINVWRREVRPFDAAGIELIRAFADHAVIALENVKRFQALEHALERQTATAEILRVISHSPSDSQPVFDAMLESAVRLCKAQFGVLFIQDGEFLRATATCGELGRLGTAMRAQLVPASAEYSVVGQCFATARVLQVDDFQDASSPLMRNLHPTTPEVEQIRTLLCVPLLRAGEPIGVFSLSRGEVRQFEDANIDLVRAFANQAVIAIDNADLFQSLQARTVEVGEALDRQTATSEVLRVISQSPTDSKPVFEAILEHAARICGAWMGALALAEGNVVRPAAWLNAHPEFRRFYENNALHVSRWDMGPALTRGEVVEIEDLAQTEAYFDGNPARVAAVEENGIRTLIAVPMSRGGQFVGVISLYRREVRRFATQVIELLRTFADQAVIAIENVRLFQTLESQRAELTRSVDEQRALGEIGQAVSSTLDLDLVLDTIVRHAVTLSGAEGGLICEHDEATGILPIRAAPGFSEVMTSIEPARVGEGVIGRAVRDRAPVHVPDLDVPGAYTGRLRPVLDQFGLKSLLAVPLLREQRVLGALLVGRTTTGEFAQTTIELLETFAAQSALAIHNARLYRELEEQGRALDAANRHKSEFLANMSHELRTPLNAVIGFSEVLGDQFFGALNEKQAEYVHDIHESGRHLLSLINDILDLSKIEAGHMELDVTRFAVQAAIENAMTLVSERAEKRGLNIEAELDSSLEDMVGDERKFKQILLNLLSNAIKFTPQGGRVRLTAVRDANEVALVVEDTGVGMTEDEQGRVFEAFAQVGVDSSRKAEGTGLGLTLTRQFVELHGGSIALASVPDEGSTFTVRLPLKQPPSEKH